MTANLPAPRGMAVYAEITDAGRELLASLTEGARQ